MDKTLSWPPAGGCCCFRLVVVGYFEVVAVGCFAGDGSARAAEYDDDFGGSHGGSAALPAVELLACRRFDWWDFYRR